MARPTDWWVLDLDSDPAPGDPTRVCALADRFLDFAEVAERAHRSVTSLQGDGAVLTWVGLSGDAFREQFGEFPDQLRKLWTSHQLAGDALEAYAPQLTQAQTQADRALADGREARDRLTSLTAQLEGVEAVAAAATGLAETVRATAPDVPPPDPEQVQQAVRDAQVAQERLAGAQGAVGSAQQALDAAKSLAEQARQLRTGAARECARRLEEASDAGIRPRSFWQKLGAAFKKLWDVICEVAKWVALVAGVIAMVIGGPLAWVALAAGAILLVKAIVDFSQGKGKVLDLVLGVLGVIPGVKGLTSVSKLSALYKAGGVKEIGKAALAGMKNLVTGLAAAVRSAATGATAVVRGGFASLASRINALPATTSKSTAQIPVCGDPVDVSTGRMFLTETDTELPGPTSFVLSRTHLSDYRAGRLFGPTWASTLDQRVVVEADALTFLVEDGTILTYPVPVADESVEPVHGESLPLSRNVDGGFTVTDPRIGRVWVFAAPVDDEAHLVAVAGVDGTQIEVVRDALGQPLEVRAGGGARVLVDVDGARVSRLRVQDGPDDDPRTEVQYDYDGRRLVEVVNDSGLPMRFDYDQQGRVTRWTDRNGMWVRYGYDAVGRCVLSQGRDGYLAYRFDYDGRTTRATDSLGHTTVYELNDDLQVVAETDALGATVRSEWDSHHRLLSRTDQLGRVTRFGYGPRGDLQVVVRPDGSEASVTVRDGRVLEVVVETDDGLWWRAFEDHEAPDPYHEPVGVARPLDVHEAALPRPRAAAPDLDDPSDLGGPPGTPAVAGAPSTAAELDAEGNEVATLDEDGRLTRTEYGPFDLPVATVSPSGARTTYEYDTELQLVAVTNPDGLVWRFRYDPLGRVVESVDFDGRVQRTRYDTAGRPVRVEDAAGGSLDFEYDVLGNLVRRVATSGTATLVSQLSYDPVGRIETATGPDTTLSVERDLFGRVTAETVDGRTLRVEYADDGRTVRRTTPAGVESVWAVDEAERRADLTIAGRTLALGPDATGGPEQTRLPSVPDAGRDEDGRITELDGPNGAESYRYSAAGDIVSASWNRGHGDTETSAADSGAAVGVRWYEGTRLVRAGEVRFAYDALGRTVSRWEPDRAGGERRWDYHWDPESRLTAVTCPDGSSWRYRYDPLGRRISKERTAAVTASGAAPGEGDERVDFTWEAEALVEQVGGDGQSLTWEYHPVSGHPVAQLERAARSTSAARSASAALSLVVTDQVGTPVALRDAEGEVTWRRRAGLWGQPLGHQSVGGTPLQFPGQYLDRESGLHYNVHRYYDPSVGRYVSPDPLGLAPSPSPVRYVDDPLRDADPLGLVQTRACVAQAAAARAQRAGQPAGPVLTGRVTKPKIPTAAAQLTSFKAQLGSGAGPLTRANFAGEVTQTHVLTRNPLNAYGGSAPGRNQAWSVNVLNHPQVPKSAELEAALAAVGAKDKWVKGHLLNEQLGGFGETGNLTALTSKANTSMTKLENRVKRALESTISWLEKDGITDVRISYQVVPSSGFKFPTSPNLAEQTIRDHLVINVQYVNLSKYQDHRLYGQFPELPPLGTKFDTITGAFTRPDGTPWP